MGGNIMEMVALVAGLGLGLALGWWLGKTSATGALRSLLAGKDADLASKNTELAAKNAEIARMASELLKRDEALAALREEKDVLNGDRAKWKQKAEGLEMQNINQEKELQDLRTQVMALRRETTQSSEQLKAAQQSLENDRALLEKAKKDLTDTFKALAAETLQGANRQFLTLATEKFDAKQQAIDTLLQPVKETLDKLDEQTRQLEVKREGAYAMLGQQLSQLDVEQKKLQQAATALSSALRDTRTTGKWGEIVLRRVVELAGMTEHCDFTLQQTQDDNRPDMVVHLPNGRTIIVDAKTSVSSFLDAAEASDENVRQQKLKEHAKNIRSHALGLAKRHYEKAFEDAIDLTVCFIPGDVYYYAALQVEPGLFEDAAEQKIVFATPTTLIVLLKAAAFGWQQDSQGREAKEILKQAQEVYDRLTTAAGHLAGLGKNLNKSVDCYDMLIGSLERSVFPAARRIKELGIGRDELPSIEPLDKTTRQLQAQDWHMQEPRDGLALAAGADDDPAASQ
jgi:DNA recombination protein RmuC